MSSRARSYVDQVYADARALGYSDVQARTLAAQSALETAYGRSTPGNNLTGIKAGSSWSGPAHTVQTWEEEGGRRVNQPGTFRSYDDPLDSLRDWGDVVGSRWPGVMEAETFPDAVSSLRAGRPGGYATDSLYGAKLGYIDRNFNDLKNFAAAIPTGIPDVTPQPRPDPQSMPGSILSASAQPASFSPISYDEEANSFAGSLMNSFAPVEEAPVSFAAQPAGPTGGILSASLGQNPFDTQRAPAPLADAPIDLAAAPQMAAPAGAAAFDMSRFGDPISMPTLPSTAQANIVGQPSISGMTGLTAPNFGAPSILDASFAVPSRLEPPAAPPMAPAVDIGAPPSIAGVPESVPGYVDPMVTTAATFPAAPQPSTMAQQSAPQMSRTAAAPSYSPSLVGPPETDPLTARAANTSKGLASLLDEVQGDRNRNMKIGGILGALAGGPVGGILGLGLAGLMSARSPQAQSLGYFPSAGTLMGNINQFLGRDPGNGGYGGLNDAGRAAYSESGQFRDAVDSGSAGLW